MSEKQHKWEYCSVGGVVRVKIENGDDIAHLEELDQKLWTVLSCPVDGLEFDKTTLSLLDADNDGKIRVNEVIAASKWLTSVLKNNDILLEGKCELALDQINTDSEAGKALYDSAKQILANLGLEKDSISVEDTSDSVRIFAKTALNGDGVITPESTDDPVLKETISACIDKIGSSMDRSGVAGVNAEQVEAFYTALSDYVAWKEEGDKSADTIFPYGENTDAALKAVEAVKEKIEDYYMRCKLIAYDSNLSAAVEVSKDNVAAISTGSLVGQIDKLADCPIANPTVDAILPFTGINPAWQPAFAAFKSLVLDVDYKDNTGLTEDEWKAVSAKLAPYAAWMASQKGTSVAGLGDELILKYCQENSKDKLIALLDADKALETESKSIDDVNKLTHFCRDFYTFLKNYVIFSDFYSLDKSVNAVFQAGVLFVDQRACKLCVKVSDMGKHADMAGLSGMFLIYCNCTSKVKNETMDIVAVMTAGGIKNLRPGTNAIFYDRDGQDWDAVITKIVDNPISIRQAFWSPYRKVANFISDKINNFAAEKENNADALLQSKVEDGAKPAFDISKFASLFSVVALAFAAVVAAFAGVVAALKGLDWWKYLIIIAAIMLVISGPACFIAWRKLRKRNLGPVLNANGWAINSVVLVNILFGGTLTDTAKYPHLNVKDPYAIPAWKKWLRRIIAIIVIAFCVLFFTNKLECIGLPYHHKDKSAEKTEAVAPAAEADVAPVEAVAE